MLENIFKHFKKMLKVLSSTSTQVLAPIMTTAQQNFSYSSEFGLEDAHCWFAESYGVAKECWIFFCFI